MSRKLQIVRTGQGITYSDGPRLSGAHPDGKVEPDAHGNRAQRRAWERLYGKDYQCSGGQNARPFFQVVQPHGRTAVALDSVEDAVAFAAKFGGTVQVWAGDCWVDLAEALADEPAGGGVGTTEDRLDE